MLLILRIIRDMYVHSVDKMQSFRALKQVLQIVTAVL
jgi:hypothetical protein